MTALLIDGANEALKALNLNIDREWISACQHFINQTSRQRASSLDQFLEICFAHILYSDLTCIVQHSAFPSDIHEWINDVLAGQFILQIQSCELVTDSVASDKHRMCKFVLTDGCANIVAIELQRIDGLHDKLCVGQKIAVRDVIIRRGVMMLTLDNTVFLGGACDVNLQNVAAIDENQRSVVNIQTAAIHQSPINQSSPVHDTRLSHTHDTRPGTFQSPPSHVNGHFSHQVTAVQSVATHNLSQSRFSQRQLASQFDFSSLPALEAPTQISQPNTSQQYQRSSPHATQTQIRPPHPVSEPAHVDPATHMPNASPQFVDELEIDDMNDPSQARMSSFYDEPGSPANDDLDFDDDPRLLIKSEQLSSPQIKKQSSDVHVNPPNQSEKSGVIPSAQSVPMRFAPAREMLTPRVTDASVIHSIVPVTSIVLQLPSNVNASQSSVNNMYSSQSNAHLSQSSNSSVPSAPLTPISSSSPQPSPVMTESSSSRRIDISQANSANISAIAGSKFALKKNTRHSLFSSSKSKSSIFSAKHSRETHEIPSTIDDVFDLPMTQDLTALEDGEADVDMDDELLHVSDDAKEANDDDVYDLQYNSSSPADDLSQDHAMVDDADESMHDDAELVDADEHVYENFDGTPLKQFHVQTSLSHRVERISQLHRPSASGQLNMNPSAPDSFQQRTSCISSPVPRDHLAAAVLVDKAAQSAVDAHLDDLPPLESATLDPAATSHMSQHPTSHLAAHVHSDMSSQPQATQSQPHPNTSLRRSSTVAEHKKEEVVLIDSDEEDVLKLEYGRKPAQSPVLNAFAAAILDPSNFRPFCFLADLGALSRSPSMNVIKVLSVKAFILSSISFRYSPRFELVVWVDDGTTVCRMQVSPELLERDAWHCSANELQGNKKLFEERRENAERFLARMEGVMTIRMAPGRMIDSGELSGRVICDPDPIILSVTAPNTQAALAMRQTAMVRANTIGRIV